MNKTLKTRLDRLEQAADPDAGTPLILFGDDPEPAPTRRPRRVIHFDEEDRHL